MIFFNLPAQRDRVLAALLEEAELLLKAGDDEHYNHNRIEALTMMHAALCRQIDQDDVADAEAVPLPNSHAIVELLHDWRLHHPEDADAISDVIERVRRLAAKGGAL